MCVLVRGGGRGVWREHVHMYLTHSPCLCYCLDSDVNLTNLQVVDISNCVWSVPPYLPIVLVFGLGDNMCIYYIINVLYINIWLTS